jgi:Zn-dependent protease
VRRYTRLRWLRVFGAPVYVHWSALVVGGVLLFISLDNVAVALETVACYLGAILLHEIGHGWFARRRGLEIIAIRIGFFHGSCEYEAPEDQRDEYFIAWGGAAFQLAVGVPIVVLNAVLDFSQLDYMGPIVVILGYLNIFIAFMNLAPAHGLDGEKAWRLFPIRFGKPRSVRRRRGGLRSLK